HRPPGGWPFARRWLRRLCAAPGGLPWPTWAFVTCPERLLTVLHAESPTPLPRAGTHDALPELLATIALTATALIVTTTPAAADDGRLLPPLVAAIPGIPTSLFD